MEVEHASRNQQRVSLLLLDLDGLKQVTDTLGHHLSDVLLRHVAKVSIGPVRKSVTVARTGGDEFSVILSAARREDASNVKWDIGDLLGQPLRLEGHSITIEARIGIAVYPDDADDTGVLCIAADRNMHVFKRSSRISIPGDAHQAMSDTAFQQSDRPLRVAAVCLLRGARLFYGRWPGHSVRLPSGILNFPAHPNRQQVERENPQCDNPQRYICPG